MESKGGVGPAMYSHLLPGAGALMKLSNILGAAQGVLGGTVGLRRFLLDYGIFVGHWQRRVCVYPRTSVCVHVCVCMCACLQTCRTAAKIIPGFSVKSFHISATGKSRTKAGHLSCLLFATRQNMTFSVHPPFLLRFCWKLPSCEHV